MLHQYMKIIRNRCERRYCLCSEQLLENFLTENYSYKQIISLWRKLLRCKKTSLIRK